MEYSPASLKKVYIEPVHGACNRRKLDAQRIASFFVSNGYYLVPNPKEADIIYLVTCAVSTKRENSSISRTKYLQKFHGELIVGGCLPTVNRERLESVHSGRSIPTSELSNFDDYFPGMQVKFSELGDANKYFPSYSGILSQEFAEIAWNKLTSLRMMSPKYILKKEIPRLTRMLTRKDTIQTAPYPIRISWGCNRNCSYCGIQSAVGKFQSKPLETCRSEFINGLENGYKEIEFIADDVGAYGIDISKRFTDLLNELLDIPGDYNVLIWNLSPIWLINCQQDFVPILQKQRITRIHYPTQSGSNKLLKAMNRYSNIEKNIDSVLFLKEHSPNVFLTTDIIIGYPGETEKDVDQTIDFMQSTHFDGVNIFMYYPVPNTRAYNLDNHIPQKLIEKRVRRLRNALEKINIDYTIT